MIAFGGLAGLEEGIEEDNNLKVCYYAKIFSLDTYLVSKKILETAPITCFQKMPIDFGNTVFSCIFLGKKLQNRKWKVENII